MVWYLYELVEVNQRVQTVKAKYEEYIWSSDVPESGEDRLHVIFTNLGSGHDHGARLQSSDALVPERVLVFESKPSIVSQIHTHIYKIVLCELYFFLKLEIRNCGISRVVLEIQVRVVIWKGMEDVLYTPSLG